MALRRCGNRRPSGGKCLTAVACSSGSGDHYTRGFYYFHPDSWRRGPVPESTDTRYRPARPGELFASDEASVRAAHARLLSELKTLEASGYTYPRVIAPVTNEWRMDNDPPYPPMAEFVATWQRLGLQPQLAYDDRG